MTPPSCKDPGDQIIILWAQRNPFTFKRQNCIGKTMQAHIS